MVVGSGQWRQRTRGSASLPKTAWQREGRAPARPETAWRHIPERSEPRKRSQEGCALAVVCRMVLFPYAMARAPSLRKSANESMPKWPNAIGDATTNYPLPTTHCQLPTAHCPLPTTNCQLPTTHCQLPTANYQLPTKIGETPQSLSWKVPSAWKWPAFFSPPLGRASLSSYAPSVTT